MSEWSKILLWLAGTVFAVGVVWGSWKTRFAQLRRDVNGIGAKLNNLATREDRRYVNLALVAEMNAPDDRKEETAAVLKE